MKTAKKAVREHSQKESGKSLPALKSPIYALDQTLPPGVRKAVAPRSYQLPSNHDMAASFLREKWDGQTSTSFDGVERTGRVGNTFSKIAPGEGMRSGKVGELLCRRDGKGKGYVIGKRGGGIGYHVKQTRARPSDISIRGLLDERYLEQRGCPQQGLIVYSTQASLHRLSFLFSLCLLYFLCVAGWGLMPGFLSLSFPSPPRAS